MKRCSKCGEEKALTEFPRHRGRRDGLDSRCKVCARIASASYRQANLEKVREKDRARVHATPIEVRRQKHKRWRDRNRPYVRKKGREVMRRLYRMDPEKFRSKSREWRRDNRDKAIAAMRMERDQLSRSYVATTLRLRTHEVPPALIEAKRAHLQIHRLLKEISK